MATDWTISLPLWVTVELSINGEVGRIAPIALAYFASLDPASQRQVLEYGKRAMADEEVAELLADETEE